MHTRSTRRRDHAAPSSHASNATHDARYALAAIHYDAVEKAIMEPSNWACDACETTKSLWLCLACGCFYCHDDVESSGGLHLVHHHATAGHGVFMELNTSAHAIYCADTKSTLDEAMDNLRGDVFLIRTLLRQAQDLESGARLTRRRDDGGKTAAAAKWRKINIVHGFTFHASYLSKQAAHRRKKEDMMYTASFKWRHLQLFKCFGRWKDSWAAKKKGTTKPAAARRRAGVYPGKTGLRNLGNTCYMNATLQALGHVEAMKGLVLDNDTRKTWAPGYEHAIEIVYIARIRSLVLELGTLVDRLWSGQYAAFSPDTMLKTIWTLFPTLAGFKQQDCDELLRHVLDQLRSEMTHPSAFDRLFHGQLTHEIVCDQCHGRSNTTESFLGMLSVDIPKAYRVHTVRRVANSKCQLTECLAAVTATERLDGDAQYMCTTCQSKQNAVKQTRLAVCPRVLVVHVNRSDWTSESQKIQTHVAFPDVRSSGCPDS
ncbi:Aste57867_11041 [Aphanomyces stellatus]|uniref:Aste57867_11041 protein n=1 Tax=Aphanomyces stellatus TaxID=120398 RepID=A0A485KRV1_9STRA|nr:hypothetical protein As57867_010999 [Aphanomyces stellatus]VFT87909.1 Aste57867_11041 [Aphanomyces stellatus]